MTPVERARELHPSPATPAARPTGGLPLARWRRIAATGFAFTCFGIGAVLLALLVFPLGRLGAATPEAADARVQRWIHLGFRGFRRLMEGLGLLHTRWIGLEALHTPGAKLVVANHPTLIDVVHLVAELPQADCIVNDARTRNPFLALAAREAGYLSNARGPELVAACAARLRAGRTVLLFPEGTRSPEKGLQPFHRGAAHVALAAGVPLVPVAIRCEPRTLMKGRPFWDVPERAAAYTLRVLEPIPAGSEAGVSIAVAARRTTAELRRRLLAWAA